MDLSKEQMEELLRQNDHSFSKVAKKLSITPQAVKQQAARMGLILVKTVMRVEPTAKIKFRDQIK